MEGLAFQTDKSKKGISGTKVHPACDTSHQAGMCDPQNFSAVVSFLGQDQKSQPDPKPSLKVSQLRNADLPSLGFPIFWFLLATMFRQEVDLFNLFVFVFPQKSSRSEQPRQQKV